MLRMAEVLREERVQMKLADAKFLLEEKLLELEVTKQTQVLSFFTVRHHFDTFDFVMLVSFLLVRN